LVRVARREWLGPLLVLPATSLILFFILYPTAFLIYASTLRYLLNVGGLDKAVFIGGDNFINLLTNPVFYNPVLLATIEYVVGSLTVEILAGLSLALLFTTRLPGVRVMRNAIVLPIFFAPITVGYLFYYILDPNIGIANYLLSGLGLPTSCWYACNSSAMFSLILIDSWQWTPFIFIILVAALEGLPQEPYEAANLDGAGRWKIFKDLTLPMIFPILMIGLILRLLDLMRNVDIIFATTKGGPGQLTEVFGYFIYYTGFQSFNIGVAAAESVVFLIVVNVIATIIVRRFWLAGAT